MWIKVFPTSPHTQVKAQSLVGVYPLMWWGAVPPCEKWCGNVTRADSVRLVAVTFTEKWSGCSLRQEADIIRCCLINRKECMSKRGLTIWSISHIRYQFKSITDSVINFGCWCQWTTFVQVLLFRLVHNLCKKVFTHFPII